MRDRRIWGISRESHIWISGCSLPVEELDTIVSDDSGIDFEMGCPARNVMIVSCSEEWRDPCLDRSIGVGEAKEEWKDLEESFPIFPSVETIIRAAARFATTVPWSHCALLLAVTVSVQWMNSSVALDDSNRSGGFQAWSRSILKSSLLPPPPPPPPFPLPDPLSRRRSIYRGGNSDGDLSNRT